MKIPSSGEKPKNLLDLVSNNNEAVKVSTRSSQTSVVTATATEASGKTHYHSSNANEAAGERATSIKFGLAKHIVEELDAKKVLEERQSKIASIKARVENGTYLTAIGSDKVAQKILEDSQLENLIFSNAANNE